MQKLRGIRKDKFKSIVDHHGYTFNDGSNAQRDIFHQMLTISALKSNNLFHNKIGLNLINERLAIKPNSCLTNRIAKRFANLHQNY